MRILQPILGRRRERPAEWSDKPHEQGWYVMFKRGAGMDILYWSGSEDDPCFEPQKNAHYFGPFRLPV